MWISLLLHPFSLALVVVGFLVLSLPCTRRWIRSVLLSFKDVGAFSFVYRLPKRRYWQGWGSRDHYDRLLARPCPSVPETIEITYGDWVVDSERGYRRRLGHFVSPRADVLKEGEKIAEFSFMESTEDHSTDSRNLVISLPAAGQYGYGWRSHVIAAPCLARGVDVVLAMPPLYSKRVSKEREPHGRLPMTVSGALAICLSYVEEVRSLINHFAPLYDKIVLAGMSYGGMVTKSVGVTPVISTLDDHVCRFGIVDFMGPTSWRLQRLWSSPFLGIATKAGSPLRTERCPVEDLLPEPVSTSSSAWSLCQQTQNVMALFRRRFYESLWEESDLQLAVQIVPRHDWIIRGVEYELGREELLRALERCSRQSDGDEPSASNGAFRRVSVPGGHFAQFGLKGSLRVFVKEILGMVQTL